MVFGIWGSDIRRDDTAGPNTLNIYQRRTGNPIYITCPKCESTGDLPEKIIEEVEDEGKCTVDCPVCDSTITITVGDFEKRYYTRVAHVEIGGDYA